MSHARDTHLQVGRVGGGGEFGGSESGAKAHAWEENQRLSMSGLGPGARDVSTSVAGTRLRADTAVMVGAGPADVGWLRSGQPDRAGNRDGESPCPTRAAVVARRRAPSTGDALVDTAAVHKWLLEGGGMG